MRDEMPPPKPLLPVRKTETETTPEKTSSSWPTPPTHVIVTKNRASSWIDDLGEREQFDQLRRVFH